MALEIHVALCVNVPLKQCGQQLPLLLNVARIEPVDGGGGAALRLIKNVQKANRRAGSTS